MKKPFLVLLLTACLAAGCGTLKKGAGPSPSGNEQETENGRTEQESGRATTRATGTTLKATPLPQTLLSIGPGEYSGITWLGGDRYAVVSDDLKGGGIVFFNIPMDENGVVGTVSMRQAAGTTAATGQARDCEGIAYVPSTGTLYVSAESDQSIREYDLAGRETGRVLRIPNEFSSKNIQPNRGFEALSYDPVTKKFWTLTEAPPSGETLLRLQRFSADGQPDGRYGYRMDAPLHSAENTLAYVHGVPAIAALPDGRLIVLEREVYVPQGSFISKLTLSGTLIRLYLVDPGHDRSEPLRKTLLCSFRTGALDLANYEGMCLGPTLPDGTRTLLLIADSENGSGGLTNEYVKVILLR